MKKFIKLMAMLSVPAMLAGGSLTLTGCSSDALTGPVVMESGGNNGGGSTTIGADHNNYSGGNNGGGSTTIGADHNN
ncbi:hypothetical protein [Rhodothermus marinus]|uniref:hypothetical protein n=1 Tax=Rhodothermus marinus TaxID=29549 RepID=UPI000223DCF0|nr:hypothetical protein [Rhodothermus marinus]AEN73722.1 hypothetical protein Rhom172_1808 [Rhodothermus marinus SG0.5JP17-172]MBO2493171.1 hypothetical protein [Rhodothermus marinus]BBM70177.1 hypothetical protein RmaAA213_20230 [Rhodothermus marinus]BBM73164.1 hypothetical protein RmaAA338_20290 [Rhodothermus marinus]